MRRRRWNQPGSFTTTAMGTFLVLTGPAVAALGFLGALFGAPLGAASTVGVIGVASHLVGRWLATR